MRPVLYYVHHHGLGHWRRALAVTAALDRPVVLASSAPPPLPLPVHARWLALPMDAPAREFADPEEGPEEDALTARGRLHWAPPCHTGLLERHLQLLAECRRSDMVTAVVDVSVEVTVLLRTSGIRVIAVRLPGERTDPAHRLGFDLADEVVMPVPARWGLHRGLPRTRAVGLVGLAERDTTIPAARRDQPADGARRRPRIAVVVGRGGSRLDASVCDRIAADLPEYDVRVLGLDPVPVAGAVSGRTRSNLFLLGRVEDVRGELRRAAVVVGNAGLGTLGDVVPTGRPFVVLPETRPFGEQTATAAALEAAGAAVRLRDLPGRGGWRHAVDAALVLGGPELVADGAPRLAAIVEEHARVAEGADRPATLPRSVAAVGDR